MLLFKVFQIFLRPLQLVCQRLLFADEIVNLFSVSLLLVILGEVIDLPLEHLFVRDELLYLLAHLFFLFSVLIQILDFFR